MGHLFFYKAGLDKTHKQSSFLQIPVSSNCRTEEVVDTFKGTDLFCFFTRGVNRGMEIRRSVLFFCPNSSIRAIFVQSGSALRKVIMWYTFITMKGRRFFFT